MLDRDDHDLEYKVVVWDDDEVSTATFFHGPLAFDEASDHFHAAQVHPEAVEAWFLRRDGQGWQIVAPPTSLDEDLAL